MSHFTLPCLVSIGLHMAIFALLLPMLYHKDFRRHVIPFTFVVEMNEQSAVQAVTKGSDAGPFARKQLDDAKKAVPKSPPAAAARHEADSSRQRDKTVASRMFEFSTISRSALSNAEALPVPAPPKAGEGVSADGGQATDESQGKSRIDTIGTSHASAVAAQNGWREAVHAELRKMADKNKVYPERARRMGWEGKVELTFRVLEDGTIRDVAVKKSSGFRVLDEAARDVLTKTRLNYRLAERMSVVLPIEYRLE